MTGLVELSVRVALVVLAGLIAAACLRRRSAALRHAVLASTLLAAPAVGPLGFVLPAVWVPIDAAPNAPRAGGVGQIVPDQHPSGIESATGTTPPPSLAWQAYVIALWATGTAVGLGLLLLAVVRLARLSARAEPVDGVWRRVVQEQSVACGLTRTVAVLRCSGASQLATWGALWPCVLIPPEASQWSEDRVRTVIGHELAHVVRHDWLIQLSAEIVCALWWWNPLVWVARRRLRIESELACDDAVLAAGVQARDYAAHLLAIARASPGRRQSIATAMPIAHSSTLERRIVAMLNPHLDRRRLARSSGLAVTFGVLAVLLPVTTLRGVQAVAQPLEVAVYDATGAVMPDVAISLAGQGRTVEMTTDAAGRFVLQGVEPGAYVLDARLPGFRPLRQDVTLRQDPDWDRAITLQVGDVRESINVTESRGQAGQAAATGPVAIRVGGNIRPPRKLHDVRPVFPPSMREAGREGVVPIEAIIDAQGHVSSVRVVSAQVHPDFSIAAVDAVRQWRFSPTLLNGTPVDVVMGVSVAFTLQ